MAIGGAFTAFAPELVIPAMITSALFNISTEHLAHTIKTTGVQDANVIKKAFVDGRNVKGEKISTKIKDEAQGYNRTWKKRFNKVGHSIKHLFGH